MLGGNSPRGHCLGGNCPEDSCLGGKCPEMRSYSLGRDQFSSIIKMLLCPEAKQTKT